MSRIQFLRGDQEQINNSDIIPAIGQPIWNKTDNSLCIGNGTDNILALTPITAGNIKINLVIYQLKLPMVI